MSQAGIGNAIAILGDPVTVDHGGTGRTTLTAGALLYGDGTNPVGMLGPLTDGQLAIGDTAGVNPVAASLTAPAAGITIAGGAGSITFALADDLAALEGLATTGMAARTGASTWATRTLQQPAAGITIADGDGVAGDPTFALSDDLAAVENLPGVGLATRTAASTWNTRSIQGTSNEITVSNGNGVSGDPTISLPSSIYVDGISFDSGTNTLGDYEEGTWTPVIVGTGVAGTGTYSVQVGQYTRIGNRVFIGAYLVWSAHTGTGNILLDGLPFTSANVTQNFIACALWVANMTWTDTILTTFVGVNSTQMTLHQQASGTAANGVPIDTAASFMIGGHYEV